MSYTSFRLGSLLHLLIYRIISNVESILLKDKSFEAVLKKKFGKFEMGYDLKRFVKQVDDELICPICDKVVKNPRQTPCEHIFCSNCIETWLKCMDHCPVDSVSLKYKDLKPTPRYFRNMVDKMETRCDHGKRN